MPRAMTPPRPELVTDGYPRPRPGWVRLATASDHKTVGVLYIATALSFAVLALVELVLMRVQLIVPQNTMIDPVNFIRLLSAYGATAVILFAVPLAAGFMSYVVPLQIGARGVAFPRLGALSYWLYLAGGIVLYASFLYTPPQAGVNPVPPLSNEVFSPTNGVDAWAAGVGLAALAFTLLAVNLLATLHTMRAPGMVWRRLPLFSWAATVACYVLVIAGPVMIAAGAMLLADRNFAGVMFDAGEGGSPVLWEHLSWFFFTSVYLAILLFGFGVISEVLGVFARRPAFGRRGIAACFVAIAALGMLAWMQNMYPAPIPIGFLIATMAFALALIVPVGVLLVSWLAAIWGGSLRLGAPLLFALGAISTIAVGLAAEMMASVVAVGWQLDDTTWATGATHYALAGGALLGGFAALHYWFPKITGRAMADGVGRASFWLILIGVHATFLPMLGAGLSGQPVEVYTYFQGTGLGGWNLAASIGSFVLAVGVLATLANAAYSAGRGREAGHDPWGGATLEWFAPSPPPEHNFDVVPDVRGAEPLLDIRDAIRTRTESAEAAGATRDRPPVA